jgi:hypothetical protein
VSTNIRIACSRRLTGTAMNTQILALAVALSLAACGGSSPISPAPTTPTPSPTPTPSTGTNWVVTQRFASVTGPDNCWVNEQRVRWTPAVFPNLPMTINHADASITFKGDFFQVNFTGTMSGSEFSATGDRSLEGGGGGCQNGTAFPQLPGVSKLTGRFSSDTVMNALEINIYPLTAGGTVTYTWEWQATRVN